MKNHFLLTAVIALGTLALGCSDDDGSAPPENFVVAFENPSVNFSSEDEEKEVKLVFSVPAPEAGTATVSYTTQNAEYGTDFTTSPGGEGGEITVAIAAGASSSAFTFNKLQDALEGTSMSVTFSITSVAVPNGSSGGTTQTVANFTETAAEAGTQAPEVGGANQGNQVYVDLSSLTEIPVDRASWDLGFYSGESFRVVINGSIFMAAAALEATDIDAVTTTDVEALQPAVAVGTFDPANIAYVDDVTGDLSGTAIAAISETPEENKVYLLNLGYEVGTEEAETGAVALNGDARGWKKIRILRDGENYLLQYADLDATTHEEVSIVKTPDYHFTFFSLKAEDEVTVQPEADSWDLNFTVFTNEIPGAGSYGYADFITTNTLAGAQAYEVDASTIAYADFTVSDVDEASLSGDQRAIGSNWRNGGGPGTLPSLKDGVFYVLQDPAGNIYKIRFTALVNESGVRGYPRFEFVKL